MPVYKNLLKIKRINSERGNMNLRRKLYVTDQDKNINKY